MALVVDAGQRSQDIVAGAEIELVSPAADLTRMLAEAGGERRASVYAKAGIWYDAIDAVSLLVERDPATRAHREHRAALLDQVGLAQAAAYDRGAKP